MQQKMQRFDTPVRLNLDREPYYEGRTLTLKLEGEPTRTVRAKIIKLHQPFTYSCVMTVELPGHVLSSAEPTVKVVLKLYDRRFSALLRENEDAGPWNEDTDDVFLNFVSTGQATDFVRTLNDQDDEFERPEQGWSPAENETYLHKKCADLFAAETRAYDMLSAFQGRQIPRLYSRVSLSLAHLYAGDDQAAQFYNINGILLEHIPGPTLEHLADSSIPQDKWQLIVDKAVQIVRDYSELGIRNDDVRPSNFLVTDNDEHRVVMIDWSICGFRQPDESDFDWRRSKQMEDEEGAIGAVMKTMLGNLGFGVEYTKSRRWADYAVREEEIVNGTWITKS